jgi:hypothetical protein
MIHFNMVTLTYSCQWKLEVKKEKHIWLILENNWKSNQAIVIKA